MTYRCEACHGQVASPEGRRIAEAELREHHDEACPRRGIKRKKEEPDGADAAQP